ncbi:hypothetical protein PR048_029403 [Dryococelus australis]|uniref:Uncharacterized protein n=1 Tax=Dryococelus australis TaxID=614101 RepID=A0ABQ9GD95_9NEOP|nr:hypothetical protein PR048_029403 [Dryococelus australis]
MTKYMQITTPLLSDVVPYSTRSALIGCQDLEVKSRLNLVTHSLTSRRGFVDRIMQPMRAERGDYGAALECKGGRNGISPRRPADQRQLPAGFPHDTFVGVTPPGTQPGYPWWEASSTTTKPSRPQEKSFSPKTGSDVQGVLVLALKSIPSKRIKRRHNINAHLRNLGSKLDPRSDLRSKQKAVAPFEFRLGLEIEIEKYAYFHDVIYYEPIAKFGSYLISISHFGTKIDESQIQNHEILLVQRFYIGTKFKLDHGLELGSFDLGSWKMLLQPGNMARHKSVIVALLFRADLPWRSRLVRHRSRVRKALGSSPGQSMDFHQGKSLQIKPLRATSSEACPCWLSWCREFWSIGSVLNSHSGGPAFDSRLTALWKEGIVDFLRSHFRKCRCPPADISALSHVPRNICARCSIPTSNPYAQQKFAKQHVDQKSHEKSEHSHRTKVNRVRFLAGGGGGGGGRWGWSEEIWVCLNNEILRADEEASSGTIPSRENLEITPTGIEPDSPRWGASSLTSMPPRPLDSQWGHPSFCTWDTWLASSFAETVILSFALSTDYSRSNGVLSSGLSDLTRPRQTLNPEWPLLSSEVHIPPATSQCGAAAFTTALQSSITAFRSLRPPSDRPGHFIFLSEKGLGGGGQKRHLPVSSLLPLGWIPASKVKKRGSDTGDTNTHDWRLVAPTGEACKCFSPNALLCKLDLVQYCCTVCDTKAELTIIRRTRQSPVRQSVTRPSVSHPSVFFVRQLKATHNNSSSVEPSCVFASAEHRQKAVAHPSVHRNIGTAWLDGNTLNIRHDVGTALPGADIPHLKFATAGLVGRSVNTLPEFRCIAEQQEIKAVHDKLRALLPNGKRRWKKSGVKYVQIVLRSKLSFRDLTPSAVLGCYRLFTGGRRVAYPLFHRGSSVARNEFAYICEILQHLTGSKGRMPEFRARLERSRKRFTNEVALFDVSNACCAVATRSTSRNFRFAAKGPARAREVMELVHSPCLEADGYKTKQKKKRTPRWEKAPGPEGKELLCNHLMCGAHATDVINIPNNVLSYLTGPLIIHYQQHGSYGIRVQTVNTCEKVIQPIKIGLHHLGLKLDPRSDLRSDTENCCTIRVQNWTGDRDEVYFEPPKLAVRIGDPESWNFVVYSQCLHTLRIKGDTVTARLSPRRNAGRVTGFSHVGIVPDDDVGRRVFSGISGFPTLSFQHRTILPSITLIGSQNLAVKSRPRNPSIL